MAKAKTLVFKGVTYKAVKKPSVKSTLTFADKLSNLKGFVNRKRNTKHINTITENGLTTIKQNKGTDYTLKGADVVYKDGTTTQKFYLECAGYLRSWKD